MSDDQRFEHAVREFADAIAANFATRIPAQPEDQLKEHVAALLRACGEAWGFEVRSRSEARAEGDVGRPDLGFTVGGLPCGYIELKAPGRGAQAERFRGHDREQWQRFKALPNLIYTDGSEWSLYRSGEEPPVARVRIAANVSAEGASALDGAALSKLAGLLRDFLMHEPVTPSTARGLAEFLAPLARLLRDEVREALDREGSAVRQIADEWRGVLFADAEADQFSDAYAQTLTYALLLARFEGAENLRQAFAVDALRESQHDLLATALDLLEDRSAREELSMPIELLQRAIEAVDARVLLAGRGRQGAFNPSQEVDRDPWLYFYEHFLGAYDKDLRKNRGVYFTPVEVVRAQVRFAAELLRDRFGKTTGFADDGVEVLDPACGTGTYPLAVLQHASDEVRERLGTGAVPERLRDLAGRLHAFEILVGPYAVAQLRLTQRLRELGVTDSNPLVYLADTLESPNLQSRLPDTAFYAPLTREHERAREVKRERRIFVCLGNPPYDREQRGSDDEGGRRKGGWVRYGDADAGTDPLLEAFLAPVREAGGGVHLKNLYNDYVYFWRWALWKVFDSTEDAGVVTFITASSYLRGPAFAGMRRKMREVFDELWIIDLEGDNLGARKTENVFAIQVPVAIAIGVREAKPDRQRPAHVRKVRLTGSEQEKLGRLDAAETLADFGWRECAADWAAPFMPAEAGGFFDWPALTDVFPWQHSGAEIKRSWPIGETREVLAHRWSDLLEGDGRARVRAFKETRDRHIAAQYPALIPGDRNDPLASLGPDAAMPRLEQYAFRSLDRHWLIADSRVGDYLRPDLWRVHGPQQTYITGMFTDVLGLGPSAMATALIPDRHHLSGRGGKDVIPLYRDTDATEPNVTGGLPERIAETHGAEVTAERLFAYSYGVLAQPAYVERFWDELEQPPPRLPITKDAGLFGRVADLGERLLNLHTYGERFRGPGRGDTPQGEARCTREVPPAPLPEGHSYDAGTRTLHVGDGEFAPVSPEVYGYSVSGFHVVKSWLDRRKRERSGRKSSPLDEIRPERWEFAEELLQLLWVLEETIRLQPEGAALLDEVCASELFTADELPTPTEAERQPPGAAKQGALRL